MTTVLEDQTISMILTIPHVKELTRTGEESDSPFENTKPPSIPVYHASIVQIEPHEDDRNVSDLIVRVQNFHHVTVPSVTVIINESQSIETPSTKRRAPICPVVNEPPNQTKTSESETISHAKRLALGLRSLRRAIIANCKVKQPTNINQINIVPVVPDVEIIREHFPITIPEKKVNKKPSSTSKPFRPKILSIKRKNFNFNKKRPVSANSVDTPMDCEENKTNESSRDFDAQPEENRRHYSFINPENREQSATFVQVIPNIPNAETTNLDELPKTFISTAKINLITGHRDDGDVDGEAYFLHPDDDTFSECYEVTYEFDPNFQHYKEQIYLPPIPNQQNQPSDITLPVTFISGNDYEQPENPHVKFLPSEDSSSINPDQTSINQSEIIPADETIYLNESSMVDEDYTVILQFLKHALQIESMPDDDCNDFNKQIKELFRGE